MLSYMNGTSLACISLDGMFVLGERSHSTNVLGGRFERLMVTRALAQIPSPSTEVRSVCVTAMKGCAGMQICTGQMAVLIAGTKTRSALYCVYG